MLCYVKGQKPQCLTEWQATPGATWGSVDGPCKQQLREALVRDQGALCAYCQRRIVPDLRMKIEHWDARSSGGADLQWTNLVGVCLGNSALEGAPGPAETHCDDSRGNAPLFLHPVEGQGRDPRQFLKYTAAGEVRAVGDNAGAESDIRALNLNATRLKRARAAVFDQLKVRLDRRSFSAQELQMQRAHHTIRAGEAAPAHAEFVLYHLRKWLRQRGVDPAP